jgi:hypothetical protein
MLKQELSVSNTNSIKHLNEDISNKVTIKIDTQPRLSDKQIKMANELILQLYVDEVIFAMDEVIDLAKD